LTRITQVEFHHSGWPSLYLEARGLLTPLERLIRCGTAPVKAYSEAIRNGQPLTARTSWVRFIMDETAVPLAPSGVAMTASLGLGEVHYVPPPPLAWLDLPDPERRRALLDFCHEHVLLLAAALDWDRTPLDLAHESVVVGGFVFSISSRPKSSPDRRHTARVTMEIDGGGDAWSTLVMHDKAGLEVLRSAPAATTDTVRNFNASKATLRWQDARSVSVVPYPIDPPTPRYRRPVSLVV